MASEVDAATQLHALLVADISSARAGEALQL